MLWLPGFMKWVVSLTPSLEQPITHDFISCFPLWWNTFCFRQPCSRGHSPAMSAVSLWITGTGIQSDIGTLEALCRTGSQKNIFIFGRSVSMFDVLVCRHPLIPGLDGGSFLTLDAPPAHSGSAGKVLCRIFRFGTRITSSHEPFEEHALEEPESLAFAFADGDLIPLRPEPKLVEQFADYQQYPAGTVLQRQGYAVASVHLIEEGLIMLVHGDPSGHEAVAGIRLQGTFLGAAEALMDACAPATAVTMLPSTTWRMPARVFCGHVSQNIAFSAAVLRALARENLCQMMQVVERASLPAAGRLQGFLRRLVIGTAPLRAGGSVGFRLPLRQHDLARLLSVTPEYLCKLLRQLEDEGTIQFRRGRIFIADLDCFLQRPHSRNGPRQSAGTT